MKGSSSGSDKGCDWTCDNCGAYMNSQPGFTALNDTWTCTECGAVNDVSDNNIVDPDDVWQYFGQESSDSCEPTEPGCIACGNTAYPMCKDSCPLFD